MIGGSRARLIADGAGCSAGRNPTGEFRLTIDRRGGGRDELFSAEFAGNWADLRMKKILARNSKHARCPMHNAPMVLRHPYWYEVLEGL